jgi:hypothetical protein
MLGTSPSSYRIRHQTLRARGQQVVPHIDLGDDLAPEDA